MKRVVDCRKPIVLLSLLGLLLFCPLSLLAQTSKKSKEELSIHFHKWLDEDVVYIISKEERDVFLKLTTDEEREQFIEQFWARRDSDPRTAINEFKEEHYRRIAYANEHFKSGAAGWTTDRGRIYIMYGPPNEREAFVSGGSYERPIQEGGGVTTTYPWERWFYRELPGIGSGIEIEFVDPTLTGEYKIALRRSEKDALFQSEGSGNTLFENMGILNRGDRLKADVLMRPLGLNNDSLVTDLATTPFQTIEKYFQLKQPAQVRFDDLRAVVSSRIYYTQLPFIVQTNCSRINRESSLAALTVSINTRDFALNTPTATTPALFNVYGRVTTINQKVVTEFDDDIGLAVAGGPTTVGLYQRKIPLKPGRYKLSLVVKEKSSGRIGTHETLLVVPGYDGDQLSVGSLLLADKVKPGGDEDTLADGFMTWSGWKVYPSLENHFIAGQSVQCYLEIYGFKVDETRGLPRVDVSYSISRDKQLLRRSPKSFASQAVNYLRDRLVVLAAIPLKGLEKGRYTLEFDIRDRVSGRAQSESTQFEISDESESVSQVQSASPKRP